MMHGPPHGPLENNLSSNTLAAASPCSIGVAAFWGKADAGSLARAGMSGSCLVERELLGDRGKQISDILGSLRRGFEEEESSLASVCFSISGRNGTLVGLLSDEIQLVSGQGDNDILVGLALEFLHPCLSLVQGGLMQLSANGIDEEDGRRIHTD